VGDDAVLVADPGPLVVSHGSRVDVHLDLAIGRDARLEWRELVVLGRTGEPAGEARLRWDVTRAGRPVLRQFVDLTDPAVTAGGYRVLATALLVDPRRQAATIVRSPTSVAQVLADGSVLATVLGHDAATATAELDRLCGQLAAPAAEAVRERAQLVT
jgi:urease accessory protein